MRIGIAGLGRIGAMHALNLAGTPAVTSLALADPAPGRAAALAEDLRAGVAGRAGVDVEAVDPAELLRGIDGLLVATPTPTHAALVHAALDAGVPTLVEKPISADPADLRAVIARAERPGAPPVLVGFQRRFDPAIAELQRRIAAGEAGDLYYVRSIAFDATPPDPAFIPTSGGIFRDLFIHDLDCVPWLVGRRVVEVHAVGSVLVDEAFAAADDVDTAAVTLTFEGGVLAHLAGGRRNGAGYDNRIEAVGSRAALTSGLDARTPLVSLEPGGHDPGADAYPNFPQRYAVAYAREVAAFCDVIAGTAANPSPARDSLTSLVLAQACEASRRSGLPIRIDPADLAVG